LQKRLDLYKVLFIFKQTGYESFENLKVLMYN